MTKIAACVLFVALGLEVSTFPVALASGTSAQSADQASQAKARKNYLKQQKKAQKNAKKTLKEEQHNWKKLHPAKTKGQTSGGFA